MQRAIALAHAFGVRVEIADLGDWGSDELRSEYDPDGPVIRINQRIVERLDSNEIGNFVALAIGHELYHHREHRGEVAPAPNRSARERAADDYARRLLAEGEP